jgi:hypothetical protein
LPAKFFETLPETAGVWKRKKSLKIDLSGIVCAYGNVTGRYEGPVCGTYWNDGKMKYWNIGFENPSTEIKSF